MQKCSEKSSASLEVSNEHMGAVLQERIAVQGQGKLHGPKIHVNLHSFEHERSKCQGVLGGGL